MFSLFCCLGKDLNLDREKKCKKTKANIDESLILKDLISDESQIPDTICFDST